MKTRNLSEIKRHNFIIALASLLSIWSVTSEASLVIKLDDGINAPIVVTDNGLGDTTSLSGVDTVNQALGNWLVNVVSSANLSGTVNTPNLSLTSFNVSFTGTGQPVTPLKIFLTDTGYGPTPGIFNLHVGGTQSGGATIVSKFFYDTSNASFGLANQFGATQSFATASYSNDQFGVGPGGIIGTPYSLTLEADITNVPSGFFNAQFTSTLTAVPLPGAVWLFGSAIMGFLSVQKRKKIIPNCS
jgi:hypothetical protein